jgi:hypothetical protein
MSFSPTESDAMSVSLRSLTARQAELAAPYDFAEFRRRAEARRTVPAERVLRIAAMVAPLALLLLIAGVERQSVILDDGASLRVTEADATAEPALVRVGPTARVNDLEDRIAWIDTMISEAPVTGLSAEDRAALRSGRDALASSLQRVRYAQTLLAY